MTRNWAAVVVALLMSFVLVACGPSQKEWTDSEAAARKFLNDFTAGNHTENYRMWDMQSNWKLDGTKEEVYVARMKKAAEDLPEMFNWAFDIAKFDSDPSNGIYKYKVKLHFRTGDPKEAAAKYKQPIPNIYDEMLLIMQKRPDGWKVLTLQKFELIDTYSGKGDGDSGRGPQTPKPKE